MIFERSILMPIGQVTIWLWLWKSDNCFLM